MVFVKGRISGGGTPVHRADFSEEAEYPCITRKMTPAERIKYGLDLPKEEERMKVRLNRKKLLEMVAAGNTAEEIAAEFSVEPELIRKRATQYGLLRKLQGAAGNAAGKPFRTVDQEFSKKQGKKRAKEKTPKIVPESKIVPELKTEPVYPQDQEANEYRYIDAGWLDAVAAGLTAGAVKHPGATWKTIPPNEHLARAMRHINLYRMGDRSEPHLVNASMRLMMAFELGEEAQNAE